MSCAVSAKTGSGLDGLRAALARAADAIETARADPVRRGLRRPPRSRSGGSVPWSRAHSGQARSVRVTSSSSSRRPPRSVSGASRSTIGPVERADAGQRVAVALPGVERHDIARGDALVAPSAYPVSYRLDVSLDELEPVRGWRTRLMRTSVRPMYLPASSALESVLPSSGLEAGRRDARRPCNPPRRDDARRRARRGSRAAAASGRGPCRARRAGRRHGHDPRARAAWTRCATSSTEEPEGVERARLTLGVLPVRGSTISSKTSAHRIDAARIRSIPESPCRPSRGRPTFLPLLPFERRGAKLYRSGATALSAFARRRRRPASGS